MSQKGSAVVEFALVVPMVLALVLGLVEVALVARTQLEVVNAAREGAREAAATPDPTRAVQAARASLGDVGATARVSVHRPHVVGQLVEVRVSVPHRVGAGFLGGFSVDITGRASMRVER